MDDTKRNWKEKRRGWLDYFVCGGNSEVLSGLPKLFIMSVYEQIKWNNSARC